MLSIKKILSYKDEILMFQTDWHGIYFSKLGLKLRKDKLPDSQFYKEFYRTLINKYKKYSDIDNKHTLKKSKVATLLLFFNLSQHNPHNTIELTTILQGQQKRKDCQTETSNRSL